MPIDTIQILDRNDPERVAAVFAIQRAAYQKEAEILGVESLPPLQETARDIQLTSDEILVALDGERAVGAIFLEGSANDLSLTISKLVVDPQYFRRGVGRRLVELVLQREFNSRLRVTTGAANIPAVSLYQTLGFTVVREFAVEHESRNLSLVTLERSPQD